jgi:hypothetical protein
VAPIPRSCFPGQQESDGTSRGVQLLLRRGSKLDASALMADSGATGRAGCALGFRGMKMVLAGSRAESSAGCKVGRPG